MGPSKPVLALLKILSNGAMTRDAARDRFGGSPRAFESALVEAGELVHCRAQEGPDYQPIWFLQLTAEGVMAIERSIPTGSK